MSAIGSLLGFAQQGHTNTTACNCQNCQLQSAQFQGQSGTLQGQAQNHQASYAYYGGLLGHSMSQSQLAAQMQYQGTVQYTPPQVAFEPMYPIKIKHIATGLTLIVWED